MTVCGLLDNKTNQQILYYRLLNNCEKNTIFTLFCLFSLIYVYFRLFLEHKGQAEHGGQVEHGGNGQ